MPRHDSQVPSIYFWLALIACCIWIFSPAAVIDSENVQDAHHDDFDRRPNLGHCSRLTSESQLKTVMLAFCLLQEVPKELALVPSVETLKLENNDITALPPDMPTSNPNIRVLFLSRNPISTFPMEIARMTRLEMLSLRDCRLEVIPENALPTSLVWLILTNNHLTALPESIGRLTRLRKFMLSGNQIASKGIPTSLASCTSLELIRLAGNSLTKFPSVFQNLNRLSWVALGENPFTSLTSLKETIGMTQIPCIQKETLRNFNEIGSGTSGNVYKCDWQDGTSSTKVVLKKYKSTRGSDGSTVHEIMMMMIAAQLHDKNIVEAIAIERDSCHNYKRKQTASLLDISSKDGIIMPFLGGLKSLGHPPSFSTVTRDTGPYLTCRNGSVVEVCNIALGIGSALSSLHSIGLFHGDIYAHNVLYNATTNVVLLGDFGAAFKTNDHQVMDFMRAAEVRAFAALIDDILSEQSRDTRSKAHLDLLDVVTTVLSSGLNERPDLADLTAQIRRACSAT